MVSIKFFKHCFNGKFSEHAAETVGRWLIDTFGPNPNVSLLVYKNDVEVTENISELLQSTGDYVILESPCDPLSAQAFLFGKEVADFFTPQIPTQSLQNTTQQSANNQLGNRTNQARVLQRIEDIYGTVRSIPTLVMPSYTKYENNVAVEYGYMCVGKGYYDIPSNKVRDGETALSLITGASAEFYEPFTSPASGSPVLTIGDAITEDVITAKRSNEVDGITLLAPNQALLQNPDTYTYTPGANDTITQPGASAPSFESVVNAGDDITVSMTPINLAGSPSNISVNGTTNSFTDESSGQEFINYQSYPGAKIIVSGFANPANNGTFTVVSVVGSGNVLNVAETTLVDESLGVGVPMSYNTTIDHSGTYEVLSVVSNVITLTTSTFDATVPSYSSSVNVVGASEWTNWIVLADQNRTKVFSNIVAPQGIYKDDGNGKTSNSVTYELQVEELDNDLIPTGTVQTFSQTLSGATSDQRAKTLEVTTSWTGFARCRMRRTTNFDYGFSGAVIDEIKWADVYSSAPVINTDFGAITTVHTRTRATTRATAIKERQFNCLVTRKLPTYDGVSFSGVIDATGAHTSGTISATKRFVDIVAAVSTDPTIGNLSLVDDVDIDQIYSVYLQVAAWSTEYGDFSYTFDDDNRSYEETIRAIAEACFCKAFRLNGKIRFNFEEQQSSSVALFTHRNKRPNSETITRTFKADADYDGVEFQYVDPDSEKQEIIRIPDDAAKYKKFDLPGIREFSTAWVRANRELNKLKFQRLAIQTDTTSDGRLLLPDSRIDIVDNTRFQAYDGEVISQNGLTLTLSKEVTFTPSETHSIVFIQRDGMIESIACTQGSRANEVILSSAPSEALVTEFGQNGIRTIYSFAADIDRDSQAYLVQEIQPGNDNYVTIRAINYSDSYYLADNATIPDKSTIIN